jgi:hypothetical protein
VIVIRWAATLIFLLCLALLFHGAGGWALWAITVATFAVAGWACGAAIPGPWIADIGEDHPDALGSLDLRDRGLPQTAGGDPSPGTRTPDA